jgi:hypothetical protein
VEKVKVIYAHTAVYDGKKFFLFDSPPLDPLVLLRAGGAIYILFFYPFR